MYYKMFPSVDEERDREKRDREELRDMAERSFSVLQGFIQGTESYNDVKRASETILSCAEGLGSDSAKLMRDQYVPLREQCDEIYREAA